MSDIKERVIRRLLGICECMSSESGCFVVCPIEKGIRCSRDVEHQGNHFACGINHKFMEWD